MSCFYECLLQCEMGEMRKKLYTGSSDNAAAIVDDDSILDLTPDSTGSFQFSREFIDKSHGKSQKYFLKTAI